MYSYFKGVLAEKAPDLIVIDVNGIGYELKIPLSTYEAMPELLSEVKVYVYTYQNDDGIRLFGFLTKAEKELFRLLIAINKVGPKLTLSLMSYLTISDLLTAIATQNHTTISKVPGIGKKTAERLIVELKDKLEDISGLETKSRTESETKTGKASLYDMKVQEVENALSSLGFKPYEIKRTIASIAISGDSSTEDIVKACIKHIYMKRNEA